MNQSSITNCNGTGIAIWAGFSGPVEPNFFVGTNSVRVGKSNSHPTSQAPLNCLLIATPCAWVDHRELHYSVLSSWPGRGWDLGLLI